MNYYEVLGVAKDATEDQIKKAYRGLARQYHPDRNPGDDDAVEKFKKVQEAYDTLGDLDKRREYDNPRQHFNMGFGGPDFFNDFINNVFSGGFHQQRRQERYVEIDRQVEIAIDFWEAVKGCDKTLAVPKFKTCETCSGSGAAEIETCSQCAGKGVIHQRQGFVTMQTTCPRCGGAGSRIKQRCEACNGNGSNKNDGTVTVQIPEGIGSGSILKLAGQGNEHMGQVGDLYLMIKVNPHELFRRHGDNLLYTMPITYSQAVLGTTLKVPTLYGEVGMTIPPNTKNQTVITLAGKGFKNISGKYGDLVVLVEIETIPAEDEEYRKLVEALSQWEEKNDSPARRNFKKKL